MWLGSNNDLELGMCLCSFLLFYFIVFLRGLASCLPASIWNMKIHSSQIYVVIQTSRERLILSLSVPTLKLKSKNLASFYQLPLLKWINSHQRENEFFDPTYPLGLGLWTGWTEWWPWSYKEGSGALKSGSCKRLFLQSDDIIKTIIKIIIWTHINNFNF